MKEEIIVLKNMQQEMPFLQNWESFTFKSLQGKSDLVVTRTSDPEEHQSVSFETSGYENPYLGVVVCKKNDSVCKEQALWVDEFLARYPEVREKADWIIVFLDIFDEQDAKEVPWIKDLAHLDSYSNVAAGCAAGACYKVFAPYMSMEPLAGNFYYVDKSDGSKSRKIITWNATENPLKLYAEMGEKVFKKNDGATKSTFDVSEYSWDEGVAPVGDWTSFTFKSLKGGEDLKVTRTGLLSVEMPKYQSPFTVVAMCKKNSPQCKEQAVWFDELAGELSTHMFGINWAIVFLDVTDESEIKDIAWIEDLSHADVYADNASAAAKVFTPYMLEPEAGNLYFVNKNDFSKNRRGVTWDMAKDPKELYETMKNQAAVFAGLHEITFNVSVVNWERGGTSNINM
jgi:hypothetical protein